jgi:hypothetical protein
VKKKFAEIQEQHHLLAEQNKMKRIRIKIGNASYIKGFIKLF